MPAQGVTNSAQPIMGYTMGAKEYDGKKAIVFMSSASFYTLLPGADPWFFWIFLSGCLTAAENWWRREYRLCGFTFSAFYDVPAVSTSPYL